MVDTRALTESRALKALLGRRLARPNSIAVTGTSRHASMWLDGVNGRNLWNACFINWAAGFLRSAGRPIDVVLNNAVSGQRTDQFGIAAVVASGARFGMLDGAVNDIYQSTLNGGYTPTSGPRTGQLVTIANVAAAAYDQVVAHIRAINVVGMTAIYVFERGASALPANQLAALNDFNNAMIRFLERGDANGPAPDAIVFDPAPFCQNMLEWGVVLRNTIDGVHDDVTGSRIIGKALADTLAPHLRPMLGHSLRTMSQVWHVNGTRGLITNPTMNNSVPVGGSNTGSVPSDYIAGRSGDASAKFTPQAATADSNGNTFGREVLIEATATGAGVVELRLPLDRPNIKAGDKIRAALEADVAAGATGLSRVYAATEFYPETGTSAIQMCMGGNTAYGRDVGGYDRFVLEPQPLDVTVFTGQPYTFLVLYLVFDAAGSAVVKTRKWMAERY